MEVKSSLTVDGTVTAGTFVGDLTGNSATATKATQDGSGNVISTYYQPKLTAGTNITIENNVISASGGGGGGTITSTTIYLSEVD